MTADIKALEINGQSVTKQYLIELGSDPGLKHFMIVMFRENGAYVAWTGDQNNEQLVYGAELLKDEVRRIVFD